MHTILTPLFTLVQENSTTDLTRSTVKTQGAFAGKVCHDSPHESALTHPFQTSKANIK